MHTITVLILSFLVKIEALWFVPSASLAGKDQIFNAYRLATLTFCSDAYFGFKHSFYVFAGNFSHPTECFDRSTSRYINISADISCVIENNLLNQ